MFCFLVWARQDVSLRRGPAFSRPVGESMRDGTAGASAAAVTSVGATRMASVVTGRGLSQPENEGD